MSGKKFLLGTLMAGGRLRTVSGNKIPMRAGPTTESAALKIAPEDVGKMAFVKGNLSDNVLYSASIVEILSPVTRILLEALINKGIVSLDELQDQLSELESREVGEKEAGMLCALVIGHKKRSPGAMNVNSNIAEFDFNEDLALRIEKKVESNPCGCSEIQKIYRRTYKELPEDINALGPDFTVSLHCNAFNRKVSGTEVLYYHKSEKGKKMAEILLHHLIEHLKLPNRGIKPKTAEDRGGYLLRYTKAPCVIAEPFFIDNDDDLARAQEDMEGLAAAYANAIEAISQTSY